MRELRMLRERAYGPDPDITGDPVASARLAELESRVLPPAPDSPEAASDTPAPTPEAEEPEPSAAREDTEPTDAPPLPRDRKVRRTNALWVASVAIALVVGAALTSALTSMSAVSRGDGGVQIATLRANSGFQLPPFLSTQFDEVVVFDEFEGLTVIASDQGWIGNGGDCMFVVYTDDIDTTAETFDGRTFPGCGAGGFPATVQLLVDDTMPDPLRARLAEGTAVQFVLDDDRVGVFTQPG